MRSRSQQRKPSTRGSWPPPLSLGRSDHGAQPLNIARRQRSIFNHVHDQLLWRTVKKSVDNPRNGGSACGQPTDSRRVTMSPAFSHAGDVPFLLEVTKDRE